MELAIFWIFALLTLAFGVATVVFRNPVNSAMSLVVCFISLAALYVMLDAYFIAVVQVLVYAGAMMVLFLFIIMLLNLRASAQRTVSPIMWGGAALVGMGFVGVLVRVMQADPSFAAVKPSMENSGQDVAGIGFTLFHNFSLPFQIIAVLLLVATVGVVLLAKRDTKDS